MKNLGGRSGKRVLVLLAAAVASSAFSRRAAAQECPDLSVNVSRVVHRFYPGGDTPKNLYPFRPSNEVPGGIDIKDCQDDINLEFTLLVSGLPCTDTIQVWAGTTDCTPTSARAANSGAPRCWPVVPTGAFAMQSSSTGNLRAQDIVAGLGSPEPPTLYSPAGAASCKSGAPPTTVGIYFLAVAADGLTVDGTAAEYALQVDLAGNFTATDVGPDGSTAGKGDGGAGGGVVTGGCSISRAASASDVTLFFAGLLLPIVVRRRSSKPPG